MQSSPTINNFLVSTNCLVAMPDANLGGKISAYLLQIHLVHLTVLSNCRSQVEEEWTPLYRNLHLSSLVAGAAIPLNTDINYVLEEHINCTIPEVENSLHYTCQNNNTEGAANRFLSASIRHLVPPVGVVNFLAMPPSRCPRTDRSVFVLII
jgi:hypothetical protein